MLVGRGRLQSQSIYLVNVENIRPSIPPPIPRLCPEFSLAQLDNFTRAILCKEPDHGARSWSSVQPYRELRCGIPPGNEPEEGICWVLAGDVDPTRVLLLGIEGRLTSAIRRGLVGDSDAGVRRRDNYREVRERRILGDGEREKMNQESEYEEIHHRSIMLRRGAGVVVEVSAPPDASKLDREWMLL